MGADVIMKTEQQKMLAGELYDALDPDLVVRRNKARELCRELNASRDADEELRRGLCKRIFAKGGDTVWMQPPFYCDYGSNIELGERVFFNFNCIVLEFAGSVLVIILCLAPACRFLHQCTLSMRHCVVSRNMASRLRLALTYGWGQAR